MGRGKIHHDDGRQILSPQLALYHAVRDYPGGFEAVAATYGWNADTFNKKLSPSNTTHRPMLEEVEGILHLTRDPRILDAFCAPVGAVWRWAEEVREYPADLDVLAAGNGLMQRASECVDELVRALEDGAVDANEMVALEQKFYRLRQALYSVKETAGRFVVEPAEVGVQGDD